MKQKRIPLRKCVACQAMLPKKELIRIVKTPESDICLDFTGKQSGRGAYICGSVDSIRLVQKNRGVERALEVSISNETYTSMEAEIRESRRTVHCAREAGESNEG
ncbi:RNase P modulator RnpM [Marinicrinis sediminis]|uniref:RNase P modulator RnpM n=1 Tax=Marinicrinis sediminis TaxID=1652465 RepID=A0ABW5R4W8_9BACL